MRVIIRAGQEAEEWAEREIQGRFLHYETDKCLDSRESTRVTVVNTQFPTTINSVTFGFYENFHSIPQLLQYFRLQVSANSLEI